MKEWMLLFVASMVLLVVCGIRPVNVLADGEESVLGQIGKDNFLVKYMVKPQKLVSIDRERDDLFGYSVAMSGNIALIGAIDDSTEVEASGSVYVFEQNAFGIWEQKQKLIASDAQEWGGFGYPVVISGNKAIIGAGSSTYIFERDYAGYWAEKQKLVGSALALSGNTLVLSEPSYDDNENYSDSVYIYEQDKFGVWIQKQKLGASHGAADDYFGSSVAISDNALFIGAYGDDDNGDSSGAVYLFERNSSGVWAQKQKITANDGEDFDGFGMSLSIQKNLVFIGATGKNSVNIFERDAAGVWSQKQKLMLSDGGGFGGAIAVSDNFVIIGAGGDNDKGYLAGAAYIFEMDSSGIWVQKKKLLATNNGGTFVFFGDTVALSDNIAIVGARGDEDWYGSAYVYGVSEHSVISDDSKYLVFKVARNSTFNSKDILTNKIRFEAVGTKRNATNPSIISEEPYQLALSYSKYIEGFAHIYYIVDWAELKTKYLEVYQNKFKLVEGGTGFNIYQQVGLRIRYDAPITASTLKDVYVTDQAAITNEKDITVNLNSSTSGETVSWTELSNNWVKGYQVFLTTSATPPNVGLTDDSLIKVPYITLDELSAEKLSAKNTYYIWVRAVNILNETSPWVSTAFSPKPETANFEAANSYSLADLDAVSGKLWYKNLLKVTDQDAAWYVFQRQNLKTSEVQAFPPISYPDLAQAGFCFIDTTNLEKHVQYKYTVYTRNALGIASETRSYQMQVKNLEPPKGLVNPGWRKLEVKTDLSLTLGPKVDPEGDRLTYYLYVRTPGAQDDRSVGIWSPQSDNESVNVTFTDQTSFEWQIRVADAFDGKEVPAADSWGTTKIDSDALIITVKNDFGEAWGTKQQPLEFSIEKNPTKTYTNYQLNFGDGTSAALTEGQSVIHQYPDLKTYQLTADAADAAGNQHQGAAELKVLNTYSGTLYDNEEWSGPEVITVRDDVTVPENFTLTIRPGTTLQMQPGASILVKGVLKAVDTSATGSINFDWQVYDSPWEGIRFQGGGSGDLRGVTLCHAERGILVENTSRLSLNNVRFIGNGIGLDYYAGPVTAANCLFQENQPTCGVYCRNSDLNPALIGCTFKDNTYPYIDTYGIIENVEEINNLPGNSGNVEAD